MQISIQTPSGATAGMHIKGGYSPDVVNDALTQLVRAVIEVATADAALASEDTEE